MLEVGEKKKTSPPVGMTASGTHTVCVEMTKNKKRCHSIPAGLGFETFDLWRVFCDLSRKTLSDFKLIKIRDFRPSWEENGHNKVFVISVCKLLVMEINKEKTTYLDFFFLWQS